MRHLSDTDSRAARGSLIWAILFLGVISYPHTLHGQYRKWSVGAALGYNQLNLDAVDEKNQSDVEGWARQGLLLGQLGSVKRSPFYSVGVSYRYDREFGVSLSGSYWTKTVSSSYYGPAATLQFERGVGSTDVMLGISYYPSSRPFFLEWYIQTNLGVSLARATAKAVGTQMVKSGNVLIPVTFVDTDGIYRKSKAIVGVLVGADMPLIGGLSVKADAGYRFAEFGTMDGDVTQLGQHSVQTSTIEFDYSGFQVSAGLRYQL
jgi:hypothetical protein